MKDFTPITYLGDNTFFIVVHPSVPAKSIAELIAHAKANPKALNYPAGNTYALVATALFAANNGIVMHPVSYKSEPDAMPDLLSGRVHLMLGTFTNVGGAREGRQAAGARDDVNERSPLMPDVPRSRRRASQVPDRPVVRAGRPRRLAARSSCA